MGDPELNCILEVCCEARAEQQASALASMMAADGTCEYEHGVKIAAWLLTRFDLAEAGTLSAFKASIARLARGAKYTG